MKSIRKNILINALAIMIGLTSCFDEKEEGYQIVGAVATVSVFSVPNENVSGTSRPGVRVNENLTVSIRYYSEHVPVTQYRIFQDLADGAGATLLYTENISDFNIENSYVDTFSYTVPTLAIGTRPKLIIEIDTENGLTNKRELQMQIIP